MESYSDSTCDCLQHRPKGDRSYAILGTGALGGYYGACLQRAGLDVHFLLHSDYNHVKQHGLVAESPNGDFTLPTERMRRIAAHWHALSPDEVSRCQTSTHERHWELEH